MKNLQGFKELNRKLKKLSQLDHGKVIRTATNAAAQPVVKRAKQLIPKGERAHKTYKGRLVAPGFSSRNVKKKGSLSRDKRRMTVSVGVEGEAYYAASFVELGTSKMPARPWLRPALRQSRSKSIDVFKTRVNKRIEQIAKGR